MTVPYLYGRRVQVDVLKRDTGEMRSWTQLATRFSVTYAARRDRNEGTLTLTNLSPDSRGWMDAGELVVTVRAGYEVDGDLPSLGSGDVTEVTHERSGPDWRTVLQLADGERAARRSRASLSYAAATRRELVEAAARALAGDHGLGVGDLPTQMADAAFGDRLEGVALAGAAGRVLSSLLPDGWAWTVLDGSLVLVPPNGVVGQRSLLLTPDTGLVGLPKPKRSERAADSGLEVRMLLDASVRPGQLVTLQSAWHSGEYAVREVTHVGDTHGQDWYSDLLVRAR